MELFDLVAKLTLDAKEYEHALTEAESKGAGIDDIEAELDLDTSPFEEAVKEAEKTDVGDPEEPDLGLNDDSFHETVQEAEETDVDDPDAPNLGLNDDSFYETIQEAETTDVDDPDAPKLDLDDEPFLDTVEEAETTEVSDPETPQLDLDASPFTNELDEVKDNDLPTFEQSVGQTLEGIKGLIAGAGIVAAIGSVVSSLSEAVDLARSMGDNIDKSSRAMSISTDAYQEWSHVMDINGASITDLNRGLMNMRKLMGGGEASKEFTEAMDKLGLSTKVANGEITSTEDLLLTTMKTLADFSGDAAQRDYLAQAIFGRGGSKLNAMFDGTSKDIDALIKQAHDLGLVMTEEEVANSAAYNDAVTNMQASIDAFKTSIVTDLLPVLTDVTNTIAKIVAFFNPRTKNNSFSDSLKETNKDLAKETASIEGTADAAMEMVEKLLQMGEAEKLTAEQQKEWKQTAEWLIANIPSLSGVIDTDTLKINGNKDAITANIKEWEKLEKTRVVAAAKEAKYNEFMEKNSDAIDKEATARAAQIDIVEKRNAAISMANQLLRQNGELARQFGGVSIDMNGDMQSQLNSVEALLSGLNSEQYDLMHESNEALFASTVNAERAQSEFDKVSAELEQAKLQYDQWVQAIDEMYGTASESAGEATSDVEELDKALEKLPKQKQIQIDLLVSELTGIDLPPKAKGDWSVPYDMPVYVHRGERILTASQARQGESSGFGISEIVGAISGLRNDLQALQLVVNGKTFGRAVVDYGGNRVDNYLGSVDSKLYSGYGT